MVLGSFGNGEGRIVGEAERHALHGVRPHLAVPGLDQGELVTIPGLHDGDEWTRFEAARRAISQRFGNSVPASRYRIQARRSA